MPARCGAVVRDSWAGVRKPPKEETAGSMGLCAGAPYGDLKVVDGARASALEREAESRGARDDDEELL
jgi:hypothetical protein